jgi:hypothetical protein
MQTNRSHCQTTEETTHCSPDTFLVIKLHLEAYSSKSKELPIARKRPEHHEGSGKQQSSPEVPA